jgi:hypothetical protein
MKAGAMLWRGRRHAAAHALLAALLAAACGALVADAAMSQADVGAWREHLQQTAAISIGPDQMSPAMLAVLSHTYSTPLAAVQSSNVYTGGNARLRRVVADLAAGRPAKIVAVGGAATNGSDAAGRGRSDYLSLYVAFLSRAFPAAPIKFVRASAGLAPSAVVAGCFDKYVPADADLVLLEMTANDGAVMDTSVVSARQPKAYEILVRKILGGARKPALVLTQVGAGQGARRPPGLSIAVTGTRGEASPRVAFVLASGPQGPNDHATASLQPCHSVLNPHQSPQTRLAGTAFFSPFFLIPPLL